MGLIDFIKQKREESNDVSTLFTKDKTMIPASAAYHKSKFGIVMTDKQLLEHFFTDVKDLINQKSYERKYCGMVEVTEDIIHFLPKIKQKLTNDLGYRIIVLDDNSVITNTKTNEKESLNTGSTFIVIFWNLQAIEDVSLYNATNPIITSDNQATDSSTIIDGTKVNTEMSVSGNNKYDKSKKLNS